jgi:hypothetical protein
MQWLAATDEEQLALLPFFSRSRRRVNQLPDKVLVMRSLNGIIVRSAMQYIEPHKWELWGIQRHPEDGLPREIIESWSTVLEWIRPLIGDRAAIEVYPRDCQIINTAPIRWFWVIPGESLPSHFDLHL